MDPMKPKQMIKRPNWRRGITNTKSMKAVTAMSYQEECPRGLMDTGILTDGVEAHELGDAIEKLGGDSEAEHKLFHDDSPFSKLLSITDAYGKRISKIMGVSRN